MKYLFTHLLGEFVFDEDSQQLRVAADKRESENLKVIPPEKILPALQLLKEKKFFAELYRRNNTVTRQSIREAVHEDQMIMQTIACINELDQACNLLSRRLREWYGLYFPELAERISNHEHFATLLATKTRDAISQELAIPVTMGADPSAEESLEIQDLAKEIQQIYALRQKKDRYLQKVMKQYCPNLMELAGATIGARLLELGRGLRHLAVLPASTIQLLGAEKALFRHLKTGAKAPKYGVIFQHLLIQNAPKDEKGKAARILADKLSLCVRLDYFKGEFKAKEYRQELEKRFVPKKREN